MMESQHNLRIIATSMAWMWGIIGLLGLCLVVFGLAISDPIESEDWLVSGILFTIFVAVPFAVLVLALRTKSWLGLGWLIAGIGLWSFGLSWVSTNG